MLRIEREIDQLTRRWVTRGGKTNRRQQRTRMMAFARHAASQGAHSLGQVGRRHVIAYWMSHRHLAPTTAYNHWRAICALWSLLQRSDEPPRPWLRARQEPREPESDYVQGSDGDS